MSAPPPPKPANLDQLYPSPWLKQADLHGRSVVVEIIRTEVELLRNPRTGRQEWKAILNFGRSKRLILNRTQAAAVAAIAGSEEIVDWGKLKVMLSPSQAPNGKPTIAIAAPPKSACAEAEEHREA